MAKGSGILRFLSVIVKLGDDRMMYNNIKKDPELRKISTHFGWTGIGYSILFFLFGAGGGALTYVSFTRNLGIIWNIFGVILGICLVLLSVEIFIFALSHTIKQMILNRRFVSWLSLIIFVLAIVSTILVLGFAYTGINNAS